MRLTRWEPFGDLLGLQERMNRIFDDTVHRLGSIDNGGAWCPCADVMEREGEIILTLELPGVEKQDIEINVDGNTLTVRGEKKLADGTKPEEYHRVERRYGTFSRSFTLLDTVDGSKIKAAHKEGLLRLTLPKKDIIKPRRIEVES